MCTIFWLGDNFIDVVIFGLTKGKGIFNTNEWVSSMLGKLLTNSQKRRRSQSENSMLLLSNQSQNIPAGT